MVDTAEVVAALLRRSLGSTWSLENVEGPGASARLRLVTSSRHVASCLGVELLSETVGKVIATVALATVLDTGFGEALGGTSRSAKLDGHGVRRRREASKCAGGTILEASQLRPSRGRRATGSSVVRAGRGVRGLEQAESPVTTASLVVCTLAFEVALSRRCAESMVQGVTTCETISSENEHDYNTRMTYSSTGFHIPTQPWRSPSMSTRPCTCQRSCQYWWWSTR